MVATPAASLDTAATSEAPMIDQELSSVIALLIVLEIARTILRR
jgi:hypothetical protein